MDDNVSLDLMTRQKIFYYTTIGLMAGINLGPRHFAKKLELTAEIEKIKHLGKLTMSVGLKNASLKLYNSKLAKNISS